MRGLAIASSLWCAAVKLQMPIVDFVETEVTKGYQML